MDDEIIFLAPNGSSISGAAQYDIASWPVTWNNPADPSSFDDYVDGGGPGGAEWDTTELRQGAGVPHELLWVDEGGEEWLSRHLIPGGGDALPDATIALMKRDRDMAKAIHFASLALAELGADTDDKADPDNIARYDGREFLGRLVRHGAALRRQVEEAKGGARG